MEFTIFDQLDLRYEALCLLERLAVNSSDASSFYSDIHAYCDYYLRECGLPEPEAARVEAVRAACRRVTEGLDIGPDVMAQYFKPFPDTDFSIAGFMIAADKAFGSAPPDEAALVRAILSVPELAPDDGATGPETFAAMAEHIAALPLPAETKWACLDLYLNYGPHYSRALELLDSTAALFAAEAAPLGEAVSVCAHRLKAWEAEGALAGAFREKGLTLDSTACDIIPCALRFSGISLTSLELPASGERLIIRYGMLFDELSQCIREQRSESDELLRCAKALADKTRVQILFALRDAPLYAQDVVSLTGLTAATVSHHMSELASAGFVAFEKQGTRILYRLLPGKIGRLAGLLQALIP